jgi:hypothetical protein
MYNLTHDESSAIDVGGIWVGPEAFELHFRFNQDDEEDVVIHLSMSYDDLQGFVSYLDMKLAENKLRSQ